MKLKITPLAAAIALAVPLIAAGCGSSSNRSPSSSAPYGSAVGASAPHSGAAATKVGIANSPLGRIIVDSKGSTLYLFEKDKGRASTCYGACANSWPPATTKGKLAAGDGVPARNLGTTERKDGNVEVTYDGHPLYYYAGDAKRGDTKGEALDQFGAEWHVLPPSAKQIDRD
jgi:predicted lipoprotein with Yx(FWY)xxD motif